MSSRPNFRLVSFAQIGFEAISQLQRLRPARRGFAPQPDIRVEVAHTARTTHSARAPCKRTARPPNSPSLQRHLTIHSSSCVSLASLSPYARARSPHAHATLASTLRASHSLRPMPRASINGPSCIYGHPILHDSCTVGEPSRLRRQHHLQKKTASSLRCRPLSEAADHRKTELISQDAGGGGGASRSPVALPRCRAPHDVRVGSRGTAQELNRSVVRELETFCKTEARTTQPLGPRPAVAQLLPAQPPEHVPRVHGVGAPPCERVELAVDHGGVVADLCAARAAALVGR
jgi:hypothetical protein